jgi:heme A synthase
MAMVIHAFNLFHMGLGICLLFFAIYLWSIFRKSSSAFLALTSFLLYCRIIITLLDYYGILKVLTAVDLFGVPLIDYALEFLVILFMIVTVATFIRDEKGSGGK